MIERFTQCKDPVTTDSSPRRLESDDSVYGGGKTDRSPGIRTERAVTKTGGGRHTGSARRCARPQIGTPWIKRYRQLGMVPGDGELGQIELAQHHCTGGLEAIHYSRVRLRFVIAQDATRAG